MANSPAPATRPINMSLVELHAGLRHMRNVKHDLTAAISLLQEQQKTTGPDTHRNAAQTVLDGELHVVEEICRKMWEAIIAPVLGSPPNTPP